MVTEPVVSEALVQAAVDAALDLPYSAFPGPRGQRCHREHEAQEGVRDELGGYDSTCPLCRVAGSHPQVAGPAREKVFRAALEAGLAELLAETAELRVRAVRAEAEVSRLRRLDPVKEAARAVAAEAMVAELEAERRTANAQLDACTRELHTLRHRAYDAAEQVARVREVVDSFARNAKDVPASTVEACQWEGIDQVVREVVDALDAEPASLPMLPTPEPLPNHPRWDATRELGDEASPA